MWKEIKVAHPLGMRMDEFKAFLPYPNMSGIEYQATPFFNHIDVLEEGDGMGAALTDPLERAMKKDDSPLQICMRKKKSC